MDMVFHAANFVNENALVLADANDVAPQAGLMIFGNALAAVFGAKYNVNVVLNQGVSHVSRLQRSDSSGLLTHGFAVG